jgi:hypothetical protein
MLRHLLLLAAIAGCGRSTSLSGDPYGSSSSSSGAATGAPVIVNAGFGCEDGYCIWILCQHASSTAAVEIATADGATVLATYDSAHHTYSGDGITLALATYAERDLFRTTGVGVTLVDAVAGRSNTVVVKTTTSASPLTPPPQPPQPGTDALVDPTDCRATDAASLRACLQQVLSGVTHRIAVMQDLTCSGAEACHLLFQDFPGPATIFSAKPGGAHAVLTRVDHFDYPLVDIVGSGNIELVGLDFQEGQRNQPAGLFGTPGYDVNTTCDVPQEQCATTVEVLFGSHDVMLDGISVLESKTHGLEIGNVERVTLRNSVVRHSWANGLWSTSGTLPVPNEHVPIDLRIENNLFEDNRCSAMELSAAGDSVIAGNRLRHNHMGSIYHVPGGQLAVEMNTTRLQIVDNEIFDGRIDEDPVLASQGWLSVAMEFTDSHVHGVNITHNFVHDVSGGSVIHDPSGGWPRVDWGPIQVTQNAFARTGAGGDLYGFDPGELVASGNCGGPTCSLARPTGALSANAPACNVDPATGVCTLTLSWSSENAWTSQGVRVLISGFTFAAAGAGSQIAPWINGHVRFDLYDGETLLGSARVEGH